MTKASPIEHDKLEARIKAQSEEIFRLRDKISVMAALQAETDWALDHMMFYGNAMCADRAKKAVQAARGRSQAVKGEEVG